MISYFLATLIGFSLGLLGGGGSILTVPILIYSVGMSPKVAIALSLAIVGLTSLFGVFNHFKNKNIDLSTALLFGPFAMFGTFLGTRISHFLSGQIQLVLFAFIMIIAAIFMFKGRGGLQASHSKKSKIQYIFLMGQGVLVGIVTGVVGVGGGFLIVPALVLLANIPMKKAVGTSLLLITLNSITGFIGYLDSTKVPWKFLAQFSAFSIIGILLGTYVMKFVPQQALRKAFAVFLVMMGLFIFYKNKQILISQNILQNEKKVIDVTF